MERQAPQGKQGINTIVKITLGKKLIKKGAKNNV